MEQELYEEQRTGWVGWIYFAGVMMVIGGALNAFYGLVAVLNDDWVVWQNSTAVFLDLTGWGWVHLVVGVIVMLCGFGVMTGNLFARTIGVIIAGISLILNFFALARVSAVVDRHHDDRRARRSGR